jgi:anti-anti-sigma factor
MFGTPTHYPIFRQNTWPLVYNAAELSVERDALRCGTGWETAVSCQCSEYCMTPTEFLQHSCDEKINVVELTLPVVLDTEDFDQINAQLSGLFVDPGGDRWVLDLSRVQYIGSSALGLLVNARHQIHAAGGRLVLCGLSPRLNQIIHTCCLERLFTIVKTRADARRELGAAKPPKHAH